MLLADSIQDPMLPTAENVGVVGTVLGALKDGTNKAVAAKDKLADKMAGLPDKAEQKLDDAADGRLGPYESPATCTPHDFDPIATAVHSGLTLGDDIGVKGLAREGRHKQESDGGSDGQDTGPAEQHCNHGKQIEDSSDHSVDKKTGK